MKKILDFPIFLCTFILVFLIFSCTSVSAQTLLINEIATSESSGDWVEIYCKDDGNGGGGINLNNFYLSNMSSKQKIFGNTVFKTGEYLLVYYDLETADETVSTGGIINTYTSTSGLTATSEQIVLYNSADQILDACCWANSSISSTQLNQVQTLITAGKWSDFDPSGAGSEDCIDSSTMGSGKSYSRYNEPSETDSRNDFVITSSPTKGSVNPSAPALAGFRVSGIPVYTVSGEEITVKIESIDADGNTISNYSGSPQLALTSGTITPASVNKQFLSGMIEFKVTVTGDGKTQMSVTDGAVSSLSDNFYLTTTEPNPVFVINEVAFYNGGGGIDDDWVEIYCQYDGTNGSGFDLNGYSLKDDNIFLTFKNDTVLKTGEYLLVRLNDETSDNIMKTVDGIKIVTSDKSGLTGTDEQIILLDEKGSVADACCWAVHDRTDGTSMSDAEIIDLKELIDLAEWGDTTPSGAGPEDCYNSKRISSGFSIGRDSYNTDTNLVKDFILSTLPTPGRKNVETGVADSLKIKSEETISIFTRRESKLDIEVQDVFGNPVKINRNIIISSSNSEIEISSNNGNTFSTSLVGEIKNGSLEIIIRGSNPASGTLKITDSENYLTEDEINVNLLVFPNIVFTEIMYNPDDSYGDEKLSEWIEIANYSDNDLDISAYTIDYGTKNFVFPAGTTIQKGKYIVIGNSTAGFDKYWGDDSGVFGDTAAENYTFLQWDGLSLSNTRGTVKLTSADTIYTTSFSYESYMGGYNNGYSLEKLDPDVVDNNDAALDAYNWKSSSVKGGSPGNNNGISETILPPLEILHTYVQDLKESLDNKGIEFEFETAETFEYVNIFLKKSDEAAYRQYSMTSSEAGKWTYAITGEDYYDYMGETIHYYYYGVGDELTQLEPSSGYKTKTIANDLTITSNDPFLVKALVNGATSVNLYFRVKGDTAYTTYSMSNVLGTNIWQYEIDPFNLSFNGIEYYLVSSDGISTSKFPSNSENISLDVVDVIPKIRLTANQNTVVKNGEFIINIDVENIVKPDEIRVLLEFSSDIFEVVDADSGRPGDQALIGDLLKTGFVYKNDYDSKAGTYEIYIKSDESESEKSGNLCKLKLKCKSDAIGIFKFKIKEASIDGSTNVENYNTSIEVTGAVSTTSIGSEGGSFSGSDGLNIVIPAGALTQTVQFKVEKVDSDLPFLGNLYLGEGFSYAFHVTPEIPGLLKPATITLPYENSDAGVYSEDDIRVLRYDTMSEISKSPQKAPDFGAGFYNQVGVTSRDKTKNIITIHTQKMGLFRLTLAPAQATFEINNFYASPNPFSPNGNGRNDSTFFNFNLTRDAEITMRLYDIQGREMNILLDSADYFAGNNKLEWDGRDEFGEILPTGIYIVRLTASDDDDNVLKRNLTVTISKRMNE